MPKKPEPTLLDLLYRAENSPLGIVVETNDVNRLRQKLYALKKEHDDLKDLILKPHPLNPNSTLFLIRRPPNV